MIPRYKIHEWPIIFVPIYIPVMTVCLVYCRTQGSHAHTHTYMHAHRFMYVGLSYKGRYRFTDCLCFTWLWWLSDLFFYIGHQISEIASSANSFKMLQKVERKYMTSKWTLAKSLVIAGIPSDHKACLGKQFSPVQVVHYLTLALQDKNMSALCPMILQGVFWNVSAKNMTTFYLAIVQPLFPCFFTIFFCFLPV